MMTKKSLLITGVYGLLGQSLVKALSNDYTIHGVDLMASAPFPQTGLVSYSQLDITNKERVTSFIHAHAPTTIINTAAITNVDLCEKERDTADRVNHQAVQFLLEASGPKTKMVQLSSDYVFDGNAGPYSDDATPNPISWYGETKLRSEKATLTASPNNLVIRTMVIVGKAKGLKPDFIHFVRSSLTDKKAIRIVTDQVGNITLASNLAQNIATALSRNESGILSLAGCERLSRFDIAHKIAERYHLDSSLISPIRTADLGQAALRPLSSGFTLGRARSMSGMKLLPFSELMEAYDHE